MLAVSNYATEWAKNNFFSEMNFKTKLGEKALFVATETNVYFYNGYTSQWDRIPLNGEVVRGLSVKNDLGAVITNKRIFGLDFENNKMNEYDVRNRGIGRLELKVDSIHFFTGDRVFQYSKHTNNFEIVRLDD
ncbi:MAG: hypothetical protein JJT78_00175 [Leptospira sp.]|nr:hypothetical protein [Leptospira sp.]